MGAKAVQLRIAYFDNDREQPLGQRCRFWLLTDDQIMTPVRREGDLLTYQPRPGWQTVIFECGRHFVRAHLDFDLFDGGTIVFGVIGRLALLQKKWLPNLPTPNDERHDVVWGYEAARFALRELWLKLPDSIRSEAKVGYAMVFRPSSGGREGTQCYFLDFR